MSKREEFEQSLKDLIDLSEDDPEIADSIKAAMERLKQDPSLFCGNPNGTFTYEDQILATALYFNLESEKIPILTASVAGEELRKNSWMRWAKVAIKTALSRDEISYQTLLEKRPNETVRFDKSILHLAVVGDGGYEGVVQSNVLNKIRQRHGEEPFDLLLHLGDIYFAGGTSAALKHFLAPFCDVGPKVLALLGNHDLYMGGEPFAYILKVLQQPGRYFSIENDDWCIACLDTSLPAQHLFRNEGELDEEQLDWLKKLIDKSPRKKIILMSHHYTVSGWERISPTLKDQLDPLLENVFAWYWGHEHGCATYGKESLGFYGACVGNGAFLEKWQEPTREPAPDWYATGRCACTGEEEDKHFWQHGYLELKITPRGVFETYHLEDETRERILQ